MNQRKNYKHNPNLTNLARIKRKNMTPQESLLWNYYLKDYPVRILRQKVIDNYIVDFYCSKAKLVIEVDGSQHYEEYQKNNEEKRNKDLTERGLYILRIQNTEITENLDGVCQKIDECIKERISQ